MAPAKEKDKPAEAKKPEKVEKVRVVPDKLTIMDDKRAQYARLVIFNWAKDTAAKKYGVKATDTLDTVENAVVLQAGKDLVGGNYLDGTAGLEFIQTYSANGSTTGRSLTTSYASEVRPFIRTLKVSEKFGRRGGMTEEEKAGRDAKRMEERIIAAAERGKVDLDTVKGSGTDGAITLEDVKNAVTERKAAEKAVKDEEAAKAKAEKDKVEAAAKEKADKQAAALKAQAERK